ncbi:MAG: hypothetical protein JWR21_8 [Herminiimonas sp.]|nr:hypothetical protein [Herminiimonas sp.]
MTMIAIPRDERVRMAKFLVAGAIAAGANVGSRLVLSIWLPYACAVTCAFLVGLTTAFLIMRRFVFGGFATSLKEQAVGFCLVNALALIQTLMISLVLARWALPAIGVVTHAEAIAHVVGVAVPMFTSYVGHRVLTFR